MAKHNNRRPARSPYNFVPINNEIVGVSSTNSSNASPIRRSGYIDFKIEAKTDIFIRGLKETFFSPNGNFCIPGSSLRGMLRTLTEICSYSKMEFVNRNRRIFFRNFRDPQYSTRINQMRAKTQAGWLYKYKNKYYFDNKNGNGYNIYNIHRNKIEQEWLNETIYNFRQIFYQDPPVSNTITKYSVNQTSECNNSGFLLITGNIPNQKKYERIIENHRTILNNLTDDIIISGGYSDVTEIIKYYESDETRAPEANLVESLKRSNPVPCFVHFDDNHKPTCIGHTPNFRIPFDFKIGNAISQNNDGIVDFAKSMFGIVYDQDNPPPAIAGKLFVEDSWALGVPKQEFGVFNILSSPKPSSYQFYLEQNAHKHQYKRSKENLITWNAQDAKIRGNKLYFHSMKDWGDDHRTNVPINGKNKSRNQIRQELINEVFPPNNHAKKKPLWTVGSVIKKEAIFRGRIRFENLNEEELGCLLFTMDLPADCFHKIGMGKPIGLGSIQISDIKLTLINRLDRYTRLFETNPDQSNSNSINWNEGLMPENTNLLTYKDKFTQYMGLCLLNQNITDCSSYWSQDRRMKELKHILTFKSNIDKGNWNLRTAYPKINDPTQSNDFKQRFVLPYPSDFCIDSLYNFLNT